MTFTKEPAIWISLIGATLALAVGFGLHLSGVQSKLIMEWATIAIPLIMGGTAVGIRSQVYSTESAQTALKMPPTSNLALLDAVIATDVSVKPGDTKQDVTDKVNAATGEPSVNDLLR